ncbi:DUF1176 domain-containing protein [Celeribacter sp. HF31]|uniref:DUF1176 domain-containing protein n=1 Tax=Celeribacter sp. HF31 TaxID=2721558 RepID=UPI00142F9F68|nr:DUF1176 domain-containing protein [Celeribacter sp. HF31]NIY78913.1 DUF1176 domain-containing protein [Celeribacter sp. HF31]
MFSSLQLSTAVLTLSVVQLMSPERASAQEVARFHHKQWQAECGPDYCALTPRAHPILSLARGHDRGNWVLSLRNREMLEQGAIQIDGAALDLPEDVEITFPEALLDGNTLEIVYAAEGFSEGVSLAGIKAALLWAEDQQGRIGDRKLTLHQPDWAALQDEARKITEEICDGPLPGVFDKEGAPQVIEGHPELRVLSQLCWTAAYNVGSQVYLLGPDLDGVDAVRSAAVDEHGKAVPELALWGIQGDTHMLDSFYKGRGLGDCFTQESYRFDGFAYVLERRVVDDACDQKIIPLVDWPE